MRITIAGAGVAGLAASLLLEQRGHDVTLIDRDGMPDAGPWVEEPFTSRPGCPQLNQGHGMLARGYHLLREHLPDVVTSMVARGANTTDANLILPSEHHDPDLTSLALRRTLVDLGLMEAVRARTSITTTTGTITGVITDGWSEGIPVVHGVKTKEHGDIAGDLVIDASGRKTRFPTWLADAGAPEPPMLAQPCGRLYYGRYYRIRDGRELPPIFSPVLVRGELSYAGYVVFWQDERIIIPTIAPMAGDPAFRALNDPDAFARAAAMIPQMAPLIDEDFAEPLSEVLALGGLRNTHRTFVQAGRPVATGFIPIGDARTHTNPKFALGMSMGVQQAILLADLLEQGAEDVMARLHAVTEPELADRYRMIAEYDVEEAKRAEGVRLDPRPDGDRQFLIDAGIPHYARRDPGVLVPFFRRLFALDPAAALENDRDLLDRVAEDLRESGFLDQPDDPTREQMLAALNTRG